MNSDKALEELFQAQTPHFMDGDAFVASLTKRLDAVEYLKQYQEQTIRRYKMAMVVASLVGIISGAVTTVYLLSTPIDVPLFSFQMQADWVLWIAKNSRLIVATALPLLMTVGIISIISNVHDIMEMRMSASRELRW